VLNIPTPSFHGGLLLSASIRLDYEKHIPMGSNLAIRQEADRFSCVSGRARDFDVSERSMFSEIR
jgi:hypothetical protein